MNPLQFTYEVDGEETVTGRIMLNVFDMRYPSEIPIEDWLNAPDIMRFIRFEERVGSLAERGIDEMQTREERNVGQRIRNTTLNEYRDFLANTPGATIRIPIPQDVTWSTNEQ